MISRLYEVNLNRKQWQDTCSIGELITTLEKKLLLYAREMAFCVQNSGNKLTTSLSPCQAHH